LETRLPLHETAVSKVRYSPRKVRVMDKEMHPRVEGRDADNSIFRGMVYSVFSAPETVASVRTSPNST